MAVVPATASVALVAALPQPRRAACRREAAELGPTLGASGIGKTRLAIEVAHAVTGVVVLVITVTVTVSAFGGNPLRPYLGAEETPGATTTAPPPVPAGSGRSTTRQSASAESSVTGTASVPSIAAAPPAYADTPPPPARAATSTSPQPTHSSSLPPPVLIAAATMLGRSRQGPLPDRDRRAAGRRRSSGRTGVCRRSTAR